jgi:excinuclease ABC subunit A
MVDRIKAMADGTRLYLMAPIVRGRKGEYRKELQELQKKGFQRVKVDGKLYEIAEAPTLDKKYKHDIDVVVDRIVVKPDLGNRLADSIETALNLAEGLAVAENADTGERTVFSSRFACPVSGFTIEEIEPRLFSFNAPQGACPACDGLGVKMFFDPRWWCRTIACRWPRARRAVGRFVGPVLPADAREHRQALQGQDVDAVARPARRRCATSS